MKDNSDWITESENADLKRKMFNDILNEANNLSPNEERLIRICAGTVMVGITVLLMLVIFDLAVEVIRGIVG